MPVDPKEELKGLLRELFQLDKTDLDFGIYRIMNMRSSDVEDFIDNKLPEALKSVTDKLAGRGREAADAELEAARQEVVALMQSLGQEADKTEQVTVFCTKTGGSPVVQKYLAAKEAASQVTHSKEVETAIYNDLYNFFNRYYEEGDFISKPRAGEHTYMIPYNGEEVNFHWANRDQYYIKTGENFRNYVFNNGDTDEARKTTVEFRLIDAETATNNNQNKKGRLFVPTEDWFHWDSESRKLEIHFEYKVPSAEEKEAWGEKQSVKKDNKGINEQLIFSHLDGKIRETNDAFLIRFWESEKTVKIKGKDENVATFYYHLNRYTATNSFDYFIHKDLRRFLLQELDYYLKHDIFTLNFVDSRIEEDEQYTAIRENVLRATAIRSIAVEIIEFLAELENFQKMLFEKKKFVVQSDYCITLDLIPEGIADEVIAFFLADPEKKQLAEWKNLGFCETTELSAEDIKADKYLPLDTRFLPAELKFKVIGRIDFNGKLFGGLLIASENYQALNFLRGSFTNRVSSVYADPPYNASASEIIYKNSYKHSSWCSLIHDRLVVAKSLLNSGTGFICCTIDDVEQKVLSLLMESVFGEVVGTVGIRIKPSGKPVPNGFAVSHEYAVFSRSSSEAAVARLEHSDEQKVRYRETDEKGPFFWEMFRKAGSGSSRDDRPTMYYPLFLNLKTLSLRLPKMEYDDSREEFILEEAPKTTEIELYPVKDDGTEGRWYFGEESARKFVSEFKAEKQDDGSYLVYRRRRPNEGVQPTTLWSDSKYSATEHGTALIKKLFGTSKVFSYPKSIHAVEDCLRLAGIKDQPDGYVLDFFAGSATTGHAVINLNLEDQGNRKYILIEMGEYFDTVTKPRIQKVVYSKDWKAGKPVRDNRPLIQGDGKSTGISHIFQYLKLEQYEDSLNNIEFEDKDAPAAFSFTDRIKYTLRKGTKDSSSLMNIGKFADPFNYEMDILKLNERVLTKVDLVTTFNFLLGIDVSRYRVFQHQNRDYHVVHGNRGTGEYICIWRKHDAELNLEIERDWIRDQDWYSGDGATVYCNSDNAFGAHGIEAQFQKLMFEDVDY